MNMLVGHMGSGPLPEQMATACSYPILNEFEDHVGYVRKHCMTDRLYNGIMTMNPMGFPWMPFRRRGDLF